MYKMQECVNHQTCHTEISVDFFILIRIRHHDKTSKEMQLSELYRYIVEVLGETKEFYTDRRPGIPRLMSIHIITVRLADG